MSTVNNNTINISDELINLICHNPEIQRMAINSALDKRTRFGDRVPITPMTLTDIAAKLAMLRWDDQVGGVKEYIRKLLCHGGTFDPNYRGNSIVVNGKNCNVSPKMIDAIPTLFKLYETTCPRDNLDTFLDNCWPQDLRPLRCLFRDLERDLLDHVTPSLPDLRLSNLQIEERAE